MPKVREDQLLSGQVSVHRHFFKFQWLSLNLVKIHTEYQWLRRKQYIHQKDKGKHDTAYVMFNEAPVNAGGKSQKSSYTYVTEVKIHLKQLGKTVI